MKTLLVVCECGHQLGRFAPHNDHGGVHMGCPGCQKVVYIQNSLMLDILTKPEVYDNNDRMTVCEVE